jgi:hypothetical protein
MEKYIGAVFQTIMNITESEQVSFEEKIKNIAQDLE